MISICMLCLCVSSLSCIILLVHLHCIVLHVNVVSMVLFVVGVEVEGFGDYGMGVVFVRLGDESVLRLCWKDVMILVCL